MLIPLLVGIVVFLGLISGIILRKIAPEELPGAQTYLRVMQVLLGISLAILFVSPSIPSFSFSFAVFAVLGVLFRYFLPFPPFFWGLAFFFSTLLPSSSFLLAASLLFLLLLVSATASSFPLDSRFIFVILLYAAPFLLFLIPLYATSPFVPSLTFFVAGTLVMQR